jgi:4-hydroxy-2-oxoheptanedioate aldolase
MIKNNILKEKLKKGETVIGTWSSLSSANVINVLGTTGLDFVVIDMEHGSMSFETVENMVRAAEATKISPIVRVWDDHGQTLLRALETGMQSVMVPHIKTASNAERIAKCCKYYPEGNRGLSPYTRVHDFTHENIEESLKRANKETLVGILIEGSDGLNNLSEIVKVPGIDLIYLGLFDICQSVGLPGQLHHPKVLDQVTRCQEIIQSNGIAAGSMATDIDYVKMLKEKNYQFIAYLNDASALKKYYDSILFAAGL